MGSVFVIVMENKSYSEALRGPFTAQLAANHGLATDYHAVAHPSLPNYLALTSGTTWGITDDGYHLLPPQGLGQELDAHGVTWHAYMEGMPGSCLRSAYPYALKHNPFAYYGGGCGHQSGIDTLPADLATSTPRFAWITPGLCNDTHDCPVSTGDAWLSRTVPPIMASAAWRDGGALFITWDEDDGSSLNHVATIVVAAGVGPRSSTAPYTHYSLLATIEDRLGVERLGASARAQPMADLAGP